MNVATLAAPVGLTAADLAERLGPMPLTRICFDPIPGTATEQDLPCDTVILAFGPTTCG